MSLTQVTGRDPRTARSTMVMVEKGIVARVEETAEDEDLYLSPGLVDLQVNGYAGFDLNAEAISAKTVADLARKLLVTGITCFAPTLITAPEDKICHGLRAISEARKNDPIVAAMVPFIHMEGPHISPLDGYRGAHPASNVRPPSVAEFDRWQDASDGMVGMVTLSPHFDGSTEYITSVVARHALVAIGHTHASAVQISRAIDAGACLATHLGNGIAPELPRHHNPIWTQLADDRVTATFIADGRHLPPEVLKAMLRAKGVERSILVSDSVALAGMPAGTYTSSIGGNVELRPDGRLCILGSELLAGSTASLAQCVGNVVRVTGMGLGDALAMATTIPGGFAGGRGRIVPGFRADLVRYRWDDGMLVEDVWLGGERVFSRNA